MLKERLGGKEKRQVKQKEKKPSSLAHRLNKNAQSASFRTLIEKNGANFPLSTEHQSDFHRNSRHQNYHHHKPICGFFLFSTMLIRKLGSWTMLALILAAVITMKLLIQMLWAESGSSSTGKIATWNAINEEDLGAIWIVEDGELSRKKVNGSPSPKLWI